METITDVAPEPQLDTIQGLLLKLYLNILVAKEEGFKVAITVRSGGECVYQSASLQAVVDCVISVFYHRYAGSLVGPNSSIIGIYILSAVFFPFLFFRLYRRSSRKTIPSD